MQKRNDVRQETRTFIGNAYPFYIGNSKLGSSWYVYQVYSPRLNEDLETPMISLCKVSECTTEHQFCANEKGMCDLDLVATILRSKKDITTNAPKFIKDTVSRIDESVEVVSREFEFPEIKLNPLAVRTILLGLRDGIRWSTYRFVPGCKVDVISSPTQFTVFQIIGEGDSVKLEPESTYDMKDYMMTSPKPVSNNINYPKDRYSGSKRASDLNRNIRAMEWRNI